MRICGVYTPVCVVFAGSHLIVTGYIAGMFWHPSEKCVVIDTFRASCVLKPVVPIFSAGDHAALDITDS